MEALTTTTTFTAERDCNALYSLPSFSCRGSHISEYCTLPRTVQSGRSSQDRLQTLLISIVCPYRSIGKACCQALQSKKSTAVASKNIDLVEKALANGRESIRAE